ncbi:MAG: hypothetical protein GXX85_01025 [Ignavibacteria bacterium]|nr:hypothetical protein [Ignavibacteria bacterium]
MSIDEKYITIKKIFWDYNTDLLPIAEVISRDLKSIDSYEFKLMLNRMLERLNWYELLDILGADLLKQLLTPETINRLRDKGLRGRYESIRRILFGEPLSVSGWDTEYRERIKHTLLSNRWYRT